MLCDSQMLALLMLQRPACLQLLRLMVQPNLPPRLPLLLWRRRRSLWLLLLLLQLRPLGRLRHRPLRLGCVRMHEAAAAAAAAAACGAGAPAKEVLQNGALCCGGGPGRGVGDAKVSKARAPQASFLGNAAAGPSPPSAPGDRLNRPAGLKTAATPLFPDPPHPQILPPPDLLRPALTGLAHDLGHAAAPHAHARRRGRRAGGGAAAAPAAALGRGHLVGRARSRLLLESLLNGIGAPQAAAHKREARRDVGALCLVQRPPVACGWGEGGRGRSRHARARALRAPARALAWEGRRLPPNGSHPGSCRRLAPTARGRPAGPRPRRPRRPRARPPLCAAVTGAS
jgi:hypothetical protein